MKTLIVTDVPTGDVLDRVFLDESGGLQYATGAAQSLFDGAGPALGLTPAEVFGLRTQWSNGYVRTSDAIDLDHLDTEVPPIPWLRGFVEGSVVAAFRFDPGQPRDSDGRWSDSGAPDLDTDGDDDGGEGDGDQFDNVERFPSAYLQRYGHVIDEYPIGEDDLFIAKTDKGAFHVARGDNDRAVLIDLDDQKAGSLADFVLLFSENQPDYPVTDPLSGATLRSLGDAGVRVEWPNGTASDLTEDGALFLQEGLRLLGPGFDEDD